MSGEIKVRLYAMCLWAYPPSFRRLYGEAMVRTLQDALEDADLPKQRLMWGLAHDLVTSVVKENWAMLREKVAQRSVVFQAVLVGAVGTMLALTICISVQQVLRMGADDPQKQMTGDAVAQLELGADAASVIAQHSGADRMIDPQRSLSPFMIVLDDAGRPLASSLNLDGRMPLPPSGVLEYVRQHQVDVLTWQPQRGVRIATVIRRIDGAHAGFVLAGRSLQEVESRKDAIGSMMQVAWLGMVIFLVLATLVFSRYVRCAQAA